MAKVTKIESTVPVMPRRKRVAAYARVSLDTERLLHSLSAQVSYYSDLIQKNPEWEYAGVFADEGITGTVVSKRKQFCRMIEECEKGNIDIILTKSIQRFARNTVDLLETVRHLKDMGVEVRFEKENINSLSEDGELMLTLLASFAQEEMQSMSDNIKWAKRKQIEAGIPTVKERGTGYRWEGDDIVPVLEEAEVVKRIFREYMDGMSIMNIARGLNADGIRTIRGNEYHYSLISDILQNRVYRGDLVLQRTFSVDPIAKVRKRNTGELPKTLVEGHHEPIIDPAFFDAVQEEKRRRREEWEEKGIFYFANRRLVEEGRIAELDGRVRCGGGIPFKYRREDYGNAALNKNYWSCSRRSCPCRDGCGVIALPDAAVEMAIDKALMKAGIAEGRYEHVREVVSEKAGHVTVRLTDGSGCADMFSGVHEDVEMQPKGKNCFSGKIICGVCGKPYSSVSRRRKDGTRLVNWYCKGNADNSCIHENLLKYKVADALGWGGFSFRRFRDEVERVTIDRPRHMVVRSKGGTEAEADFYARECRWQEK